jgi:hypothetical protein
MMAGGHNPRLTGKERVRQRFLHKLQYYPGKSRSAIRLCRLRPLPAQLPRQPGHRSGYQGTVGGEKVEQQS